MTVQAGGSFSDLLLFLPGFNVVCLGGACTTTDGGAITHEDGRLDLETTGRATKTVLGGIRTLALTAADPVLPEGALGRGGAAHSFQVRSENVPLPDLVLWRTALTVAPGRVTYEQPPNAKATTQLYVDDAQGSTIAQVPAGSTGATFDRRLLEDMVGRVFAVASVEEDGVETDWRSPTYGIRGRLKPPSRGAACVLPGGKRVSPCGLTDGKLWTTGPSTGIDCSDLPEGEDTSCKESQSRVDLDLGTARRLTLVVVRGTRISATVSTSVDGVRFTPVPLSAPRAGALDPVSAVALRLPGTLARYVRVSSLEPVSEVSAW